MDYSGTWFVNTAEGDDYIGFVFGYQSNRRFYLVLWRHGNHNYGDTQYRGGIKGIQIKVQTVTMATHRILIALIITMAIYSILI